MRVAINPRNGKQFFKQVLNSTTNVILEEAISRSEKAFRAANLQEHKQFGKDEILKEHPIKQLFQAG